ncbi:uncharacterized protein AKAW2_40569A [Aspergillus luchuensis]|uniref:Uncharacterized protein n=1 Tax=Aspergillus kawachii TaxID=1069201 RepID=A0A7R7ZZ68_ASPKA|nr:uncharacterized protein AKAW2_40569A [Aspergillus luchuensis]BCR98886.1 hypothetical protein AKAW2_40569A [Aspergillus luchuensis]
MLHENGMQIEDSFWYLVTQGCWRALVKKETAKFCSPWMLTSEGAKKNCNWVPVTPDSSLAFDILVDFCISKGLEMELVTGLASVLLLTSRNTPSPILAPAVAAPTASAASPSRAKHAVFYELYQPIDKFLTLSSTQDALDPLICSAFFDPSIPCNFMGAASLGSHHIYEPVSMSLLGRSYSWRTSRLVSEYESIYPTAYMSCGRLLDRYHSILSPKGVLLK